MIFVACFEEIKLCSKANSSNIIDIRYHMANLWRSPSFFRLFSGLIGNTHVF